MHGHDEEVERLRAGVSCATVLEKSGSGWTLDLRQSTRHALKYRRGPGKILIISHEGQGWWDPLSDAKGDVFGLVQFLDGSLNFGEVRRVLRGLVGVAPRPPSFEGQKHGKKPALPPAQRWAARSRLHHGSSTWSYLTQTRALPARVLSVADAADALCEGPRGSAWFAHRDHEGHLTGIEMRGPSYRGFTRNGRKVLFRLPVGQGLITRVAVCEAPIDAMSLAAIEHLQPGTLYLATGGGMGPDTIQAITLLLDQLRTQPCPHIAIATDDDTAGERYADRLKGLADRAGIAGERCLPPHGHKDWNAFLQAQVQR